MAQKSAKRKKPRTGYGEGSLVEVERKTKPSAWLIAYYDERGRKRNSPRFDSPDEALKWNRARLDKGSPAPRSSFAHAAESWFNGRDARRSASTTEGYRRVLDGHVLPAFGARDLSSITGDDLNLYCIGKIDGTIEVSGKYKAKQATKTLRTHMWMMRSIYDHAIFEGWHSGNNPARSTSLKINPAGSTSVTTPPALTNVEREAFLLHVPDEWKPFIDMLLGCGMRFGEATGLKWGDRQLVRDEHGRKGTVIHIKRTALQNGTLSDTTKTESSRRSIQLFRDDDPDKCMVTRLQAHWRRQNERGLGGNDDLMFPTSVGTVMRNNNFSRRHLKRWARAAGIKDISPHVLRHTFAYVMLNAHTPVRTVKELMGHSSAAFTIDRYGIWIRGVDVPTVAAVGYSATETQKRGGSDNTKPPL